MTEQTAQELPPGAREDLIKTIQAFVNYPLNQYTYDRVIQATHAWAKRWEVDIVSDDVLQGCIDRVIQKHYGNMTKTH